jgi:ABC-type phosphate/phosphonate transport system substrate-binding protein
VLCTGTQAIAQGFVLSAPPRETPENGMKQYGPIAAHLSKLLGVEVTYKHPENWLKYQREMRNDKYDFVFDGPHFISWRVAHLGNEALVRLPGELQFILVNKVSDTAFDNPDKLIGKKICGISPPNLATLSVLDYYRNPVRQPVIKGINGGAEKVYQAYLDNKFGCDAVIFRTDYFNKKLTKAQRADLKLLYTSKAMPNQGITASKRVSREQKDAVIKEFTVGSGVGSTAGIIKRFAGNAKSFIPVKENEYDGYNMLLEGVIFGWE